MLIKGFYEKDDNFFHVYTRNAYVSIAKFTGDWGAVYVGDMVPGGKIMTRKWLSAHANGLPFGMFEIDDDDVDALRD